MRLGPLQLYVTPLLDREGLALFNSASAWSSDEDDLRQLYKSTHTSLVTTRTAVVTDEDVRKGTFRSSFAQSRAVHDHSFLRDVLPTHEGGRLNVARGSLNSYAYSPYSLDHYLGWIDALWQKGHEGRHNARKPFLISVTGSPAAVEAAIVFIRSWTVEHTAERDGFSSLVGVEINLSCPNAKGAGVPSGYDGSSIKQFVLAAQRANSATLSDRSSQLRIAIALKLPPYTYPAQFDAVLDALSSVAAVASSSPPDEAHPITFLTCTNTLGGAFWLNAADEATGEFNNALPVSADNDGVSFDGTGGLGGESLHAIALGNVFTFRRRLTQSSTQSIRRITVIGVGGVISGLSARRMKAAGAQAVGLATALGREGPGVFERISNEISPRRQADKDDDDDDASDMDENNPHFSLMDESTT